MKTIVSAALALAVLATAGAALCQEQKLTASEQKVYDRVNEVLFETGEVTVDAAAAQVSAEMGITKEEVDRIRTIGLERKPSQKDWQVYDEVMDGYIKLGEDPDWLLVKAMMADVGKRHGMSALEVSEIQERCMWFDLEGER